MTTYLLNEVAFLEGISVEDVDKAKIAAEAGNSEAQYHLAVMFDVGRGVVRNPQEAEKWYKKAAEQGHVAAAYFLARMYSIQTSGIARNEEEALRWFKIAAVNGHEEAKKKLQDEKIFIV